MSSSWLGRDETEGLTLKLMRPPLWNETIESERSSWQSIHAAVDSDSGSMTTESPPAAGAVRRPCCPLSIILCIHHTVQYNDQYGALRVQRTVDYTVFVTLSSTLCFQHTVQYIVCQTHLLSTVESTAGRLVSIRPAEESSGIKPEVFCVQRSRPLGCSTRLLFRPPSNDLTMPPTERVHTSQGFAQDRHLPVD